MSNDDIKKKSFWERPEGTTGMIFLAILTVSLGFGAFTLLPIILTLLQQTVYLVAMSVLLFLMLFVAFDEKSRKLISYMYRSLMRKITGIFIELDPIGILKSYIEDFEKTKNAIDGHIERMYAQRRKIEADLNKTEKELKEELQKLEFSKKNSDQKGIIVSSNKVNLLSEDSIFFNTESKHVNMLINYLERMERNTSTTLTVLKNEVASAIKRKEYMETSYKAFKGVMAFIKKGNEREEFDLSMDYLSQDYANKLGQIEYIMSKSNDFFRDIDFKDEIAVANAEKMLSEFESRIGVLENSQPKSLVNR